MDTIKHTVVFPGAPPPYELIEKKVRGRCPVALSIQFGPAVWHPTHKITMAIELSEDPDRRIELLRTTAPDGKSHSFAAPVPASTFEVERTSADRTPGSITLLTVDFITPTPLLDLILICLEELGGRACPPLNPELRKVLSAGVAEPEFRNLHKGRSLENETFRLMQPIAYLTALFVCLIAFVVPLYLIFYLFFWHG